MAGPTVEFWEQLFDKGQMPWDRGEVNAQLLDWFASGEIAPDPARPLRVLVPGCGSGYEVAELARRGFEVTGLDYAAGAVALARERINALDADARGRARVELADVLHWQPESPVDLVYEQTCLCAVHPDRWVDYATQLHRWIAPGGRLFALFVQIHRPGAAQGEVQGPPYHCDINGMRALFPASAWAWPKPPYPKTPHPKGMGELAVVLGRR